MEDLTEVIWDTSFEHSVRFRTNVLRETVVVEVQGKRVALGNSVDIRLDWRLVNTPRGISGVFGDYMGCVFNNAQLPNEAMFDAAQQYVLLKAFELGFEVRELVWV